MSGHSHWAGIKHKKEITDKKRAKVFSKSLKLISAAAHSEPNPDFNPRLRTAVAKAREAGVPADTIDRAIKRAADPMEKLEELLYEAYGPGGGAILITAISDNRNRTVQEIKTILRDHNGKWAESGSVQWGFELAPTSDGTAIEWTSKFPQEIPDEDKENLVALLEALEENDDVQNVYTNINFDNAYMIALGIDPGTRRIGYGVVTCEGPEVAYVAAGILAIDSSDDVSALEETKKGIDALIKKYKPDVVAIEKLFFAKNTKTALAVAQARGVILLAVKERGVHIKEYTPNEVKSGVAGYGMADKKAVLKMVRLILGKPDLAVIDDASDALALAILSTGDRLLDRER